MEENPPVFLSKNIRCLRKKLQLSQEELARRIGLNRGNIASYEKGTAEPKICNLLKLAHIFNVSVLDLTGRDLSEMSEEAYDRLSNGNGAVAFTGQERKELEQLLGQVSDLEKVVDSIYNCHCFNKRATDIPTKEFQTATAHLEQLHEVTHEILRMHRSTLEFLKAKFL